MNKDNLVEQKENPENSISTLEAMRNLLQVESELDEDRDDILRRDAYETHLARFIDSCTRESNVNLVLGYIEARTNMLLQKAPLEAEEFAFQIEHQIDSLLNPTTSSEQ